MSASNARRAVDLTCAAIALAAAVVIYRGWRAHGGLWLNLPRTPVDGALEAFARAHPIPSWTRDSLPDALWQYAFGATMAAVWRGAPLDGRKVAFVLAPGALGALGALVELAQWARLAPGTFDPIDLAASALAASAAIVVHGELIGGASDARTAPPRDLAGAVHAHVEQES